MASREVALPVAPRQFGAVLGGWLLQALPYAAAVGLLLGGLQAVQPHLPPGPATALEAGFFGGWFGLWWFSLGVLQTVGFGSGLQSGVMFMLPHVLRTTVVADACGHLNFASLGDMWWSADPALF